MRNTKIFLLPLTLLVLATGARPQGLGLDPTPRVTVDPVSAVNVRPGQSAPVAFTFHIKPGFHINSNKPLTPELIPTELKFSPPQELVVAKVEYPAGTLVSFPFDPKEKLSVYSGEVTVRARVLPAPHAGTGSYTVHAEFKYQACDDNSCYPPKRLPVAFDVRISRARR